MVPILDTVKEARLDRSSTLVKNLLLLCLINIAVIWQLMTEWYIHRPVLHLFSPEKLLAVDGKWHRDPQHGQHVESERLWSTQPQIDCIMKCLYSRNRYIWEKKKKKESLEVPEAVGDSNSFWVFLTQQGWCMYEVTEAVTAWTGPAQMHTRQSHGGKGGVDRVPKLATMLFSIDSYWEKKQSVFNGGVSLGISSRLGVWRRIKGLLEWPQQVVVSHQAWILMTKCGSTGKAGSVLNFWAIIPTSTLKHLMWLKLLLKKWKTKEILIVFVSVINRLYVKYSFDWPFSF